MGRRWWQPKVGVLRQLNVLSGSALGRLWSKCFKLYQTSNSCNHINNIGLELGKAMRNRHCFILGTITGDIQICWFNDYLLYTFNQRFLSMWSLSIPIRYNDSSPSMHSLCRISYSSSASPLSIYFARMSFHCRYH